MSKFSLSRIFGRTSKAGDSPAPGLVDSARAGGPSAGAGLKAPEDGIHVSPQGVLHLQGDHATLALHGGARHQVMMQNAGAGITVSLISSPHPGAPELRYAKEFALVQASAAQTMFSSTVAAWHRTLWIAPEVAGSSGRPQDAAGSKRSTFALITAGALVAVAFMIGMGMLLNAPSAAPTAPSLAGQSPAAGAAAVPQTATLPSQSPEAALAQAQSRLQQARLPQAELSRVNASAHRIQVREGSAVLMAFSDPNCPACQELEREAATLKAGQGFAVIPVGFQPGSRVLAARVLCAKDPARAWADTMRGIAPTEQACEAGLRKVDENNNLFASIGASATPTLLAANGQMAQGAASGTELQQFASAYAK